jgi:polygalacturonase
MRNSPLIITTFWAISLAAGLLEAEVTMPAVFSDHMVLQREVPVTIWGQAEPGESVSVRFGELRASAVADDDGAWSTELPPLEASFDSRELIVEGSNKLTYEDVLVGEVWLLSGQSNMEKPIGEKRGQRPTDNYRQELAAANFPHLRFFQVPRYGEVKKEKFEMQWIECSPENLEESAFSAAGYYFGREILHTLDVPVGLIHSSFGGTMIEAWMPREAFGAHPDLSDLLHEPYFAWVKGVQATELFESMIAPLVPYSLRGFLWYQGEANAMNGETSIYAEKMEALVEGWRNVFNAPEAPFYFVQLAPFTYSAWDSFPAWLTEEGLPLFWEVQSDARNRITNSGMVVTTDLAGDASDIHPTNKREVGLRLAHLALRNTYGETDLLAECPRLQDFEVTERGTMRLTFDHVGDGLTRANGEALNFFEIAGKSRVFRPAAARILDDSTVEVSSSLVRKPVAVRFAWDEIASPNLVNSAGLPAEPFRTDDWPVIHTREKPNATIGWDTTVPEILSKIVEPTFPDRDFLITDFGARANDGKLDTDAIHAAIQACHDAGGGRVVVPAGAWDTIAIHLLSNVNLHLEDGSKLLFSTDWAAYPIVFTRYEGTELMNTSPLIYAYEQENIAVTGSGILDGQADYTTWWITDGDSTAHATSNVSKDRLLAMGDAGIPVEERVFSHKDLLRPNFIQPYKCKNVLIEGITINRAPMWNIHPVLSRNVTVRGVTVDTHGPNNDGCNPESSQYVLIEDCTFNTGDDCIAIKSGKNNDGRRVGVASENIIIRNCHMIDGHGGVVLGSEVSGDIRNVFAENCIMDSPRLDRALRFKSNTVRGGIVENIFMRNVEVGATALAVVTANFMYDHRNKGPYRPVVRNVHVENVNSTASPRVLMVKGIPEGVIDGIHFRNCTFRNITHPDIVHDAGEITFENVMIEPKAE